MDVKCEAVVGGMCVDATRDSDSDELPRTHADLALRRRKTAMYSGFEGIDTVPVSGRRVSGNDSPHATQMYVVSSWNKSVHVFSAGIEMTTLVSCAPNVECVYSCDAVHTHGFN